MTRRGNLSWWYTASQLASLVLLPLVYLHGKVVGQHVLGGTEASRKCVVYLQNHYGFVWNLVHTFEFVAYHPDHDVYIDWATNDYQCPGWEGQSWWYWLNSTSVRPLAQAPPGCTQRAYAGPPEQYPDRFVDWILNTRDGFVKRTGLPELTITFGPVTAEQQQTREGLMREVGYLQRLPQVVPSVWVPSDRLATIVDFEWGLLDRLHKPLVAIHIRGGDKHGENVAMFGDEVAGRMADTRRGLQALATRHPSAVGGTCVVMGDGSQHAPAAVQAAMEELKCEVVNQVYPRTDYDRDRFLGSGTNRCLAGTHVFTFIELLARADYTVGSLHNAPYQVASFLRQFKYGKAQDTCVDNADFGQPAFLY